MEIHPINSYILCFYFLASKKIFPFYLHNGDVRFVVLWFGIWVEIVCGPESGHGVGAVLFAQRQFIVVISNVVRLPVPHRIISATIVVREQAVRGSDEITGP